MAKAKAKDERNLPTGRALAESGYHGFNADVGPPVEPREVVTVGVGPTPPETKPARRKTGKK